MKENTNRAEEEFAEEWSKGIAFRMESAKNGKHSNGFTKFLERNK